MSEPTGSLNKAIWGPHFWTALHALSEEIAAAAGTDQIADILQEWARLTRYLSEVLPCKVCQEHARLWRRPNFAKEVPTLARTWTYDFHEDVKARLKTNGRAFPIAELVNYKLSAENERIVLESIQLGVDAGIVATDAAAAWRRHWSRLRILLSEAVPAARICTCICTCGAGAQAFSPTGKQT